MKVESLARPLSEHSVCRGLLAEHIEFLSGCARQLRVPAGRFLIREGQPADALYLVRVGKLAVEVHDGGRGAIALETVGPDDALGWAALNPPFLWTADARAIEPTVVLAIDAACLRAKLEADHTFGYRFTTRLLAEVYERLERARLQVLDVYGTRP